jgi:YHS domain-containing protein
MQVDESKCKIPSELKGNKYFFCAPGCKPAFDRNPEKYLTESKKINRALLISNVVTEFNYPLKLMKAIPAISYWLSILVLIYNRAMPGEYCRDFRHGRNR